MRTLHCCDLTFKLEGDPPAPDRGNVSGDKYKLGVYLPRAGLGHALKQSAMYEYLQYNIVYYTFSKADPFNTYYIRHIPGQ